MKTLIFTLIMIPALAYTQANVEIKNGSIIDVQTSNGDILIESNMTDSQLTQELGVNPPDPSGINSFTGPNGCTNCIVPPNTAFDFFWDVTNVAGCTATNTLNNSNWNGSVQPFGGGTGTYQKTISGGVSSNATFTLNCPAPVKTTNYQFQYLKEITKEITIPSETRLILHNYGETLTIINLVVDEKIGSLRVADKIEAISEKTFFTEIYSPSLEQITVTITNPPEEKLESDVKIWSFITETDPRIKPGPPLYKNGKCESLDISPDLRISTYSIMKENSKAVCLLEPSKKYFITNVYLKRDLSEIQKLINEQQILRGIQ